MYVCIILKEFDSSGPNHFESRTCLYREDNRFISVRLTNVIRNYY